MMVEKTTPPGDGLGGRAGRAGGTEGFADAFNSPNSRTEGTHQGAIPLGVLLEIAPCNVGGSGSVVVNETRRAMAAQLFAVGGMRAFECPKSSAVVHEAGHCVNYAIDGVIPTRAIIWPERRDGRVFWLGHTDGSPPWEVSPETDPQADLREARSLLAGRVAEQLFDPDWRLGSSLDELATALAIVKGAAQKMQSDPPKLFLHTWSAVAARLKAHDQIVRTIADRLCRKRSIEARHLEFLLAPIKGTGTPPATPMAGGDDGR